MENQEFQKHVLSRLQKLEEKTFGGTFEQHYKATPREHAEHHEQDGKHHFIGDFNKDSATQKVKSFFEQYDKGSVNSLYGKELEIYHEQNELVQGLVNKFHLEKLVEELRKQ